MHDVPGGDLRALAVYLAVELARKHIHKHLVPAGIGRRVVGLRNLEEPERQPPADNPAFPPPRAARRIEGFDDRVETGMEAFDDDPGLIGFRLAIIELPGLVFFVDLVDGHRLFRHRLVFGKPDHRPGLVLDVKVLAVAVLGRLYRVPRVGRDVHEHAGADDAPVLADDGIGFSPHLKNEQLVRMVVQLRTGARDLVDQAKIHVVAFDDRRFSG